MEQGAGRLDDSAAERAVVDGPEPIALVPVLRRRRHHGGDIAGRALPAGARYLAVFRFAGATAFYGYALALWQNTIWYKKNWMTTLKSNADGLIYALLTAGFFGWLWPR
jgi:hypothetical protein